MNAFTRKLLGALAALVAFGAHAQIYSPLVNGGSFNAASPPAIGGTTPAAGSFNPLTVGPVGSQAILQGDAANTLAQRNTTNPQLFRIYNTFTDAANYERFNIRWNANVMELLNESAGTGTNRGLSLGTVNTTGSLNFSMGAATQWIIQSSGGGGHLQPGADSSKDLGGTALFVKDGYVRRRLTKIATVTYSASMTPDAALGEIQQITATNGTAFTINAPTNPVTGQLLHLTIRNTSGGALGVATWNAVFKMATWTSPATAFSRTTSFYYDGSSWIQLYQSAADVPN